MKTLICIIFIYSLSTSLRSQDSTMIRPAADSGLDVYIECQTCDVNYLSENLDYVNFVTEPSSADVRLIVSELSSGGGTAAIGIILIGQKRFGSIRDTINYYVPPDALPDQKRNLQLEKIQLGLVPFVLKTPASNRLMLLVGEGFLSEGEEEEKDSWSNWTFELSGMGSIYSQKNYQYYNLNLGLNVSKVTEKIKIESYNRLDYSESKLTYTYFDIETNSDKAIHYNTCQRGFFSSNLVVKSIGKRFGAGGLAIVRNDHPNNMSLRVQVGPAVEFNIYPYKEALQKQFRFMYSLFYEHSEYLEPSIFNKMHDESWKQNLRIMARFSDTWGYLDASLSGSSYIPDMTRYSVGASTYADIRVYKGFSVNFHCGLAMYRDRINEPKGIASFEEVLTRQREIATDYQYNFSFGITYRFGSKKYPAVNPRFSQY